MYDAECLIVKRFRRLNRESSIKSSNLDSTKNEYK